MLKPSETARAKEAVLAYSIYGAGKSLGWATIADWYRNTETPGHFHIISTEYERAEKMAESYPDFDKNCTIWPTEDYDTLADAARSVKLLATPDDWCVLDSAGNTLLWTRDKWFNANRGGLSWRDFQATGGTAKDVQPSQWIEMDELYRSVMVTQILRFPGHKYITAQAELVATDGAWADKGPTKELYGRIGVKPIGHKELGFLVHTVLHFANPSKGEWTVTTVKDAKGREYLERAPMLPDPIGFVGTYLMGVAGWSQD